MNSARHPEVAWDPFADPMPEASEQRTLVMMRHEMCACVATEAMCFVSSGVADAVSGGNLGEVGLGSGLGPGARSRSQEKEQEQEQE